ncbi:MAG: T9SS type A sorting domain-containing protein [Flavobacteriales bacterium]
MSRLGRLLGTLLSVTLLASAPAFAQGDCLNEFLFPSGAITPDAGGAITLISTCSYESEYSHVTGIEDGATYRFRLSSGGYITVREGAPTGPVVAQGYAVVDVLAVGTADLYPHWTINDACDQQSACVETDVQYFGGCAPVLAYATLNEDCAGGFFMINVDVVSLGSSATVDIVYDVFGFVQSVDDVGLGVTELGPFFPGEEVAIVVEHDSDPGCSMDLGTIVESGECPVFIFCGDQAQSFGYCYANNETKVWNYTSLGGSGSMILDFISGTIDASFNDVLTIYDGTDDTAPILFQHTGDANFDLGNVFVVSTSGSFHMRLTSTAFGSCADGQYQSWNWQVQCLNCQLPQATATNVDDCVNNSFDVEVNVASTGDGSTVTIVYAVDGGDPVFLPGVVAGITVLGPFTINQNVSVFVQHESDPACNLELGLITDGGDCPNIIVCGAPPLEETYCYEPNDLRSWSYLSSGTGTLRLRFIRGTIESNTFDDLRIYDGPDATGTLVFEHNNATTYNLGPVGSAINNALTTYYGVEIYSVTGNLYMEMSSDGSVQCGGPFPTTTYDSWEWEVVCLDCEIPQGTVTVVDDCANDQFSLAVDVTSTGDGATASVIYTVDGGAPQTQTGLPLGITNVGPFNFGEIVNLTLAHESNDLCNIAKGNFTDTGTCPTLIDCGTPATVSYCYANNNDVRWYYQGTGTFPLGILFTGGTVFAGDVVEVYDGGDINAPLIYSGNGNATDITGLFFFTTNPEHRMTVRVLANGFTDCATSAVQNPVQFSVDCLDCVPPAATFSIVQDCANFQYSVAVNVASMGSATTLNITNTGGAPDVVANAAGTWTVGPFTSGTPTSVTAANPANSLCSVSSGTLVNPLCPTFLCGSAPLNETYCYINNENRAWAWEAPSAGATLNLAFVRGTIESNTWDNLRIYDGPDATAPLLFQHGAGTQNLGPTGSAVLGVGFPYETINVTSTGQNLYMTLTTDASVACITSTTNWDPWEWNVTCTGCAAPGVSYNLIEDCLHRSYMAEVIVTTPPSSDGMTIENVVTGTSQSVSNVGIFTFGPYGQDSLSIFGITDLSEPGCTYLSDSLTFPSDSCVIVSCGFDNYEYCYENNEDRWYTYRSLLPVPTTIAFLQGPMLAGDRIVVYNGADETATVIYQGNNGGNLAGFAVNSQNASNTITMRIQTNGAGSCDDGLVPLPLRWSVGCGAVGIEEQGTGGFTVYPNPTDGLLYISLGATTGNARARVIDMSGRTVIDAPINLLQGAVGTIDMSALQSGQYAVLVSTADWTKVQRVEVMR